MNSGPLSDRAFVGMPHDKEVGENIDYVNGFQFPVNPDCEALPCELVDDVQNSVFSSVMRNVFDKVIRPDMVWILRSQTDT